MTEPVRYGTIAQGHGREMEGKYQMAGRHQRAADRTRFQIGQGHRHRIHERTRGIDHGETLQNAADGQADEIDREADNDQPEMPFNQARIRPLPGHDAWHHEVDRAEHHHRHESVEPQVGMGNGEVREMRNGVDAAQCFKRALDRTERVHQAPQRNEAQRR